MDIAGMPQHLVQRGNNRMPCFLDDLDRRHYLRCLERSLARFGCALHAFVLMDNHVHLLATPATDGAISRTVQHCAASYVAFFNHRHERTGTLWEGRYHSSLVDSDHFLLACHRYIELNPIRARMVLAPSDHAWSSHCANASGQPAGLLQPHDTYLSLGRCAATRRRAYLALFADSLSEEVLAEIRGCLRQRAALGSEEFRRAIENRLGRFAGVRAAHRPRKPSEDSE